jgi:drug/metabolite transporter (DMT)-like permease
MLMEKNILKGALLVGLGASSYGALATVVKLAYARGFTTAEVTTSQFSIGFAGLLLLNVLFKKTGAVQAKTSGKTTFKLLLGGTSLGLTSMFYYFSVRYIPVSVAIVLLMQSVWMGLLLEAVLDKKRPSLKKLLATAIVLFGTGLATNIFSGLHELNWKGLAWGLTAGLSYTISLYATNSIATHLPAVKRSMWLLAGGLIVIVVVFSATIFQHFNFGIFWPWGFFLAFFGTILPPLLFTSGMPHTGIGLGTIVAAIELPVSVMFAYVLLKEPVSILQWAGIVLIIGAIVLMNVQTAKKEPNHTALPE